jgi:CRISPR-associated endonuclease/helicase Cas3
LAEEAISLTDRLRLAGVAAPIVGVIANRVGRARSVRDRLHEHASVLVIGRSRPIDRDRIAAMLDGLKTGRGRPESPLMLVGTQTLEAGIDVDLDGLVTEAAPLDSLRQRFGRVNRAGREIPAAGVVLGSRRARDADPIYGAATAATIAHLWTDDATSIDFGIDAMSLLLAPAVPPSLLAPRPDAPMLMPAYVTLWAQTSPRPMADPEPALFLHGVDREPASVQVVWRADLDLRCSHSRRRGAARSWNCRSGRRANGCGGLRPTWPTSPNRRAVRLGRPTAGRSDGPVRTTRDRT